jgi:LPS sulfotransferase NodH
VPPAPVPETVDVYALAEYEERRISAAFDKLRDVDANWNAAAVRLAQAMERVEAIYEQLLDTSLDVCARLRLGETLATELAAVDLHFITLRADVHDLARAIDPSAFAPGN